jgi:hypothetical protein
MPSKIKVELKAGKRPEQGQNDAREVFLGTVDQTPGSTLSDDQWFRRLPGQKQEHLFSVPPYFVELTANREEALYFAEFSEDVSVHSCVA